MPLNILHITPHLGGGIGNVVMTWVKNAPSAEHHTIVCLDKNKNSDWILLLEYPNITVIDNATSVNEYQTFLKAHIDSADIVVLHWWNHPQVCEIIVNLSWSQCRLVLWNHVSGLFPPYILDRRTVEFSDFFVNTSPVSLYNTSAFAESTMPVETIWSTVGTTDFIDLTRTQHDDFIVGYTGTVDIGKLHKDFLTMSASAILDNIRFVVCSGDSQEHLKEYVAKLGVSERFSFLGRVPSVLPHLSQFDVFGYPLHPKHFGTCEQSLGEAMMAGCVPVVLNNPTESYIVEHGKSGIVANSHEEYANAIKMLYNNRTYLKELSDNARKRALALYALEPLLEKWQSVFDTMMQKPKRSRTYKTKYTRPLSPAQLYAVSLGEYAGALEGYSDAETQKEKNTALLRVKQLFDTNPMFYSNNKGSPKQYLQFFPQDPDLKIWANL